MATMKADSIALAEIVLIECVLSNDESTPRPWQCWFRTTDRASGECLYWHGV